MPIDRSNADDSAQLQELLGYLNYSSGKADGQFLRNLNVRFPSKRSEEIFALCKDQARLESMPVNEFVELFVI